MIATDLLGYGRGELGAGDHSRRSPAADQARLMVELGHHRSAVAGHERGAPVWIPDGPRPPGHGPHARGAGRGPPPKRSAEPTGSSASGTAWSFLAATAGRLIAGAPDTPSDTLALAFYDESGGVRCAGPAQVPQRRPGLHRAVAEAHLAHDQIHTVNAGVAAALLSPPGADDDE